MLNSFCYLAYYNELLAMTILLVFLYSVNQWEQLQKQGPQLKVVFELIALINQVYLSSFNMNKYHYLQWPCFIAKFVVHLLMALMF